MMWEDLGKTLTNVAFAGVGLAIVTAEQLGKPIGSDSENGKTTFVTLFGADGAMQLAEKLNDETCAALHDAFGEKSAFLEQLARTLLARRS